MFEPFTIHPATSDPSFSPLVLEASHTSRKIPEGEAPKNNSSHEGWDIGLPELFRVVQRQLGAWGISSKVGRLFIEHNRTADYCLPKNVSLSREEGAARIAKYHTPYVRAVEGVIADQFVARNRLPVVISVHTCTGELDGKRRRPFIVAGDDSEGQVLIPTLKRLLEKNFQAIPASEFPADLIKAHEWEKPVALNDPFNLRPPQDSKVKTFWGEVQAPHYAATTDKPWALVEIRNNVVGLQAVKGAFLKTLREVMGECDVRDDLRDRERRLFGGASSRQRSWLIPAGAK